MDISSLANAHVPMPDINSPIISDVKVHITFLLFGVNLIIQVTVIICLVFRIRKLANHN